MYKNRKISVVVPAFNEVKYIFETLTTIPKWVDQIFAVNDASTDHTKDEILKAIRVEPRIIYIELDQNSGVGAAIVRGYAEALKTDSDILAVMAGDGQMDPIELERLVEPIADNFCDMSKGNRLFSSESVTGMPRRRVLGNIFLTMLTKIGSGYWSIVDPQNGFVAVKSSLLRKLPLNRISKRYDFENDFLCQMRMLDARILDVPIASRYRDETSTLRILSTAQRILLTLIKGFFRRIFVKNLVWSFTLIPIFFIFGIILFLGTLVLGLWAIQNSLGEATISSGTSAVLAILILLSSQFLLTSFVLDVLSEPRPKFNSK